MFTITTEPRRKLVRIKVCGMLKVCDVADFLQQEHAAIRAMGCPVGHHFVLADLTDCPLQLQEIIAAFQKSMTSPQRAKRVAVAVGSSLSRMQARRLLQREEVAMFDTVAEAEKWLFREEKAAA
jgi:hypothetical protein